MKSNLNYLNYTEFKEHLDNKKIKYVESNYIGFPHDMTTVTPKSKDYKSKKFYTFTGDRYFKKKPIIRNELDRMDYTEFIDYLDDKDIEYEEIKEFSRFSGFYIGVIPKCKKLKQRNFYCFAMDQKFGEDDWYNYERGIKTN